MKKMFQYNDKGACLNPNVIEHRSQASRDMWKIETAKTPDGEWIFATSFSVRRNGSYSAISLNIPDRYDSERKAIIAASTALLEDILHEPGITATMLTRLRELYHGQLQLPMAERRWIMK